MNYYDMAIACGVTLIIYVILTWSLGASDEDRIPLTIVFALVAILVGIVGKVATA